MRRNIDKAHLNLADARGIGRGLGFGHQARAFEIGGKDEIDQVLRPAWCLLLDTAETRRTRERYSTRVRHELARDHFEQRRLPAPLRPTKPARALPGRAAVALSKRTRGPSLSVMSLMWSMRACRLPDWLWQGHDRGKSIIASTSDHPRLRGAAARNPTGWLATASAWPCLESGKEV
jgi:hypothetical protein